MNIFVGNLSAAVTADDLRRLFAGYGTTINAIIMRDTDTGLPLGYGHVYLVPEQAAYAAIINLDKQELKGSPITVRECMYRTRQERRLRRFLWRGSERRIAESRRHNGYDQTSSGSSEQRIG
jgi:RNA recognition motif-containing protein